MAQLTPFNQLPWPPDRPPDAHKGTFGTVIVVGGSPTMIGAPAIAARAALRVGTGLVKIATTEDVLPHAIAIEPGATGLILDDHAPDPAWAIDAADDKHRAILAVGPGMGQSDDAASLIEHLLAGPRTAVLDADGLNLLAKSGHAHSREGANLVMTPHPGEFKRLAEPMDIKLSPTDPDTRPEAAAQLARAHHAVVVLKGHRTVVTDGDRLYLNHTGNPVMATAGSGDVLTGALAGLIAQGMSLFDAAVLAVHVHGRAADQWAAAHGPAGMLARELADHLIGALQSLRPHREKGTAQ